MIYRIENLELIKYLRNKLMNCGVSALESNDTKKRCGSLIISSINGTIISEAYNEVLMKINRDGIDLKSTIHAEQRAMIKAIKEGIDLTNSIIFYARLNNTKSEITPSRCPSCIICADLSVFLKISYWVIWHNSDVWGDDQPMIYIYKSSIYTEISHYIEILEKQGLEYKLRIELMQKMYKERIISVKELKDLPIKLN